MSSDTSTLKMHHHINHLTLSERKIKNFQKTEQKRVNTYFFYAGLLTSFRYLNTTVGLNNADPVTREKSK